MILAYKQCCENGVKKQDTNVASEPHYARDMEAG